MRNQLKDRDVLTIGLYLASDQGKKLDGKYFHEAIDAIQKDLGVTVKQDKLGRILRDCDKPIRLRHARHSSQLGKHYWPNGSVYTRVTELKTKVTELETKVAALCKVLGVAQ